MLLYKGKKKSRNQAWKSHRDHDRPITAADAKFKPSIRPSIRPTASGITPSASLLDARRGARRGKMTATMEEADSLLGAMDDKAMSRGVRARALAYAGVACLGLFAVVALVGGFAGSDGFASGLGAAVAAARARRRRTPPPPLPRSIPS